MDAKIIYRISQLFRGLSYAHGIFVPDEYSNNGVKKSGKCQTVKEPVTGEKWLSHLEGKKGLGVIPINEENKCLWAVIDIDNYELSHLDILKRIDRMPFVFCKSKSGGIHLFLFFKEPAKAKDVREFLRNQVGLLGLGNSEIFPKQDQIIAGKGDVGNWLNMPYFGNTRKCCVLVDDQIIELEVEDFIEWSETNRITLGQLISKSDKIDYEASPIKDGPPCLQVLSLTGFPEGTRNKSLFNLGVYLKRAYPLEWGRRLEAFNKELFKQPLFSREVQVILKSLDKKDYSYQCYEEPLCSFCNAKLCRTRKFGISASTAMPIINSVTKISGDTSLWFIDVEGGRLELTTEELYDNRKFRIKCINSLSIIPISLKNEQWHAWIQQVLDKAIIINDDTMFKRNEVPEQFLNFAMSRVSTKASDMANGRVYYDKDTRELSFKVDSFLSWLRYKKIQIEKGWIVMYLKNRGVKQSVGKDSQRKSFRYCIIKLEEEETVDIEKKIELENAI